MRGLLRRTAKMDTASLQQGVAVLRKGTNSKSSQKFAALFAVLDVLLLREAETKQVCPTSKASMAVQT